MRKCKYCGEIVEIDFAMCTNCGADLEEIQKISHNVISDRYPALRTVATLYKILAVLKGIVVAMFVFYILDLKGLSVIIRVVSSVIGGLISFISLLAVSEGIMVFLDIEENTRVIASNLRKKI